MPLLSSIITPAVVAGVISLLINNRNEKIRAQRDFLTKAFDPARDVIDQAIQCALDYFPEDANARTKRQEAALLASERNVRHSVSALLALHAEPLPGSHRKAQDAFDDFVVKLTSGNFQQKQATADVTAAILVADAGANLRAALLALRSEVLQQSIENDLISSMSAFMKGIGRYLRP